MVERSQAIGPFIRFLACYCPRKAVIFWVPIEPVGGKKAHLEKPDRPLPANPATGETIQIAASKKRAFTVAKAVKDCLNG